MIVDLEAVTRDARQAWAASAELRAEFGSEDAFLAYRRAEARGAVRIHSAGHVVRGSAQPLQQRFDTEPVVMHVAGAVTLDGAARGRITGYAARFGTINRKGLRILRGAFRADRITPPVPMLLGHDSRRVIGSFQHLVEDEQGLLVDGQINLNVPAGREAFELVRARDVCGLSVGFAHVPGGDRHAEDGTLEFSAVDLLEITVTPTPAEPAARITNVGA